MLNDEQNLAHVRGAFHGCVRLGRVGERIRLPRDDADAAGLDVRPHLSFELACDARFERRRSGA